MVRIKQFNSWRRLVISDHQGPFDVLPVARHKVPLKVLMAIVISLMFFTTAFCRTMHPDAEGGGPLLKPAVGPNNQLRVHRVSKVEFSITNYGIIGSQGQDETDPLTGEPAPSCEFPAGSNLDYLFQGALWIGATKVLDPENYPDVLDTLVSIGNDGWWGNVFEMFPGTLPRGDILMLSIRGPNVPPYADTMGVHTDLPRGRDTLYAVSEQDFIAVYTDTLVAGLTPDPNDGRNHIPLELRIVQKSYSWSYEYAEDFILIDFEIENLGDKSLKAVWIGLYIDADVLHMSEDPYGGEQGAQDDICGFLRHYVSPSGDSTEIFTAYIADNDGQPYGGVWDPYLSPRGVSGCRVVQSPDPDITYAFNWWISNMNSELDWGPQHDTNFAKWGIFPGGGKGTPGGDRAKYQVMSNGEFDYDQIYCNLDWTNGQIDSIDWISSVANSSELANGYDTRYLYSFGPFDSISAHEILPLTIGYICGEDLHNDPNNYSDWLEDGTSEISSIETYYNNLDFTDFATNAQWAEWVFDNPIYDTDGDGVADKGDGIPDFKGPPPPHSPRLRIEVDSGYVQLSWTSINIGEPETGPEDSRDTFSDQLDFEGYRIYKSYNQMTWDLLRHYDRMDWVPEVLDSTYIDTNGGEWQYYWKLNPERIFPVTDTTGLGGDTIRWVAQDLNIGFDNILDSTKEVGGDTIRYYSFRTYDLCEAQGIYFSITAFDFGNPQTDLSPLESSKYINSRLVYPIRKTDPVIVYPNPYKISNTQAYIDAGFESPGDPYGWVEQDRRIWFSNLPDDQWAIIRIWTLDGDLVRAITYDPRDFIGYATGTVYWDLISRNTQAVVSGLYLYSIEYHSIVDGVPDKESEIGKFVIIK
jgi:hypothetical protein